ncbi:MAG: hypothetical protein ACOYXC_16815 [Candidatus Rifleibacteriota bacterium]
MARFTQIFNSSFENGAKIVEITKTPEELKKTPEGLFRSCYLLETDSTESFQALSRGHKEKVFGPLCLIFSVRRARDLLSEGCDYQGVTIEIENNGRKLPQLPGAAELARILGSDSCLILVNGSPFKPATEVFGFQQVYDDSVKCIDALKKMGIPQETIAIYATPEEICIEVHPGVFGLEGQENLPELYYRVLCHLAEIREVDGRPVKAQVRTIVLQSCNSDYQVLLPGSTHPVLHRTKVGVGASHFAYGVAAFSDFCAKKRTIQECLQETLNWLKFMQTPLPPVAGLREKVMALPDFPFPGGARGAVKTVGQPQARAFSGRFQPLNLELEGAGDCLKEIIPAIPGISSGLDRSLGSGWSRFGVHLLIGPIGSGKAGFLVQQALKSSKETAVLYVSFEQNLREFSINSAFSGGSGSLGDMLNQASGHDENGLNARKQIAAEVEKLRASLPESFFFSGVETSRETFDVDEIGELARMLPQADHRLVVIESLNSQLLGPDAGLKMQALRRLAQAERLTFMVSLHQQFDCPKRPHFIEGIDQEILEKFQRHCDSISVFLTEKLNLRRFVAMIKGQIDPQLIGKLEQKALQLSGGRRSKNDSYTMLRLIHSRLGRKELLLYLFQPDFIRFFEIATLPLSRP